MAITIKEYDGYIPAVEVRNMAGCKTKKKTNEACGSKTKKTKEGCKTKKKK